MAIKTSNKPFKYNQEEVRKAVEQGSLKALRKEANRLFSAANKRIDRLVDSSYISPAYEALKKSRTGNIKFTTGGKNFEQLEKEFVSAMNFMNARTSTISGAKDYTNDLKQLVGERVYDRDYVNDVFDLMHGVAERLPIQLEKNMIGTNGILNAVIESTVDKNLSALNEQERSDFISDVVQYIKDVIEHGNGDLASIQHELDSISSRIF